LRVVDISVAESSVTGETSPCDVPGGFLPPGTADH
jgi:hypothetical protein